MSPFPASVTWRISVAGLTHGNNIAEHIRPSRRTPVNFPFSTKHGITPPGVMVTRLHSAFAFPTGSLVHILSNTHFCYLLSWLTAPSVSHSEPVTFTGSVFASPEKISGLTDAAKRRFKSAGLFG